MTAAFQWFQAGGPVMFPIFLVGLVLYGLVFERLVTLYGPAPISHQEHNRGLLILRALVGAAPLLGLLGTVSGMISSFDSLVDGNRIGELGQGIGYALRTTQYGLAVAVPGLLLERMISRRALQLSRRTGLSG